MSRGAVVGVWLALIGPVATAAAQEGSLSSQLGAPPAGATPHAEEWLVADSDASPGGSSTADSLWHFDIDLGFAQRDIRFVGKPSTATQPCEGTCTPSRFDTNVLQGTVGIGIDLFAFELGLGVPVAGGDRPSVYTGTAGIRFDSSRRGWLSMFARVAYLERWGEASGQGGRTSAGLMLRPIPEIAAYAEASAEVTSAPSSMVEAGAFLSYATALGGGVRLVL